MWNSVRIIRSEEHCQKRRLKESAHMLGKSDLLKTPSIEMNTIWEIIIKKVRWKQKMKWAKVKHYVW